MESTHMRAGGANIETTCCREAPGRRRCKRRRHGASRKSQPSGRSSASRSGRKKARRDTSKRGVFPPAVEEHKEQSRRSSDESVGIRSRARRGDASSLYSLTRTSNAKRPALCRTRPLGKVERCPTDSGGLGILVRVSEGGPHQRVQRRKRAPAHSSVIRSLEAARQG